jgi:N-acetylneuraminic acid mutarotase
LSDVLAVDVNQHSIQDMKVSVDGRQGASGVYAPTSGKTYLFGGRSGSQATSWSILSYDVNEMAVDRLAATLPVSRTDTAAVYDSAANQAYIFGGVQPGPIDYYFADVLRFDEVAQVVVPADAVLPTGRAGMSAAYVPQTGMAYLFGGVDDSGAVDDILVYDPVGDSMATLAAKLPRAAAYAATAYDDVAQKAYLFGGWAPTETGGELYYNQIVAFDVVSETAALLPVGLPQFLAQAAAVSVPGESTAFLMGGAFFTGNLFDIYRFDGVKGTVTQLQDMRLAEARVGEVAVYVPAQLTTYLFGGTGSTLQPLYSIATLKHAYPVSATAQSLTVNGSGQEVSQALLVAQQALRRGAVAYSLSNNGGQTWEGVRPGAIHVFASTGSDLRWRAVLSGEGETTPTVDSLTILYDGIHQVFLPVILRSRR